MVMLMVIISFIGSVDLREVERRVFNEYRGILEQTCHAEKDRKRKEVDKVSKQVSLLLLSFVLSFACLLVRFY
jgi:hypothetical protein